MEAKAGHGAYCFVSATASWVTFVSGEVTDIYRSIGVTGQQKKIVYHFVPKIFLKVTFFFRDILGTSVSIFSNILGRNDSKFRKVFSGKTKCF